jgi:DNA primase
MAKISPVSIKYMIYANFRAEGALEKPDIIGALFGQTEGLLGSDLEMRELQKEGKIGRIEVELERKDKITSGIIKIPTALDQSETTLIAAAIETIERIGPCDSQIEVEKVEDVRGNKRDYIIERAKKLMSNLNENTNSKEISDQIKDSMRMDSIKEYGNEKLPYGDLSKKEIIVVEGRADVLNLLKNNINNVIAMNGTKLPEEIIELGNEKDLILFVDGDRGGRLIAQNVFENARINEIAFAPEGKEVEELNGKEIWKSLRKKIPIKDFAKKNWSEKNLEEFNKSSKKENTIFDLNEEKKSLLKNLAKENNGTEKAVLLDENLNEIKKISIKGLKNSLKRLDKKPTVILIDGTATSLIIELSEEIGCKLLIAKNFATRDTNMKLLSL